MRNLNRWQQETPDHEFEEIKGSSWNWRRKRRRNRYSFALFAVALVYSTDTSEAFITSNSRSFNTLYAPGLSFRFHSKQTLSTKRRRTRPRDSHDSFSQRYHARPASDLNASSNEHDENTEEDKSDENMMNPKEISGSNKGRTKSDKSGNSSSTVYEDLQKLERAIELEKPELKLRQLQLQEQIEFKDQRKRLLIPDTLRFLVVPLFYSYGLFKLLSNGKKGVLNFVGGSMIKAMDLHFWFFVVTAPLLMNASKIMARKRQTSNKDPIPDELKNLDPICATVMLSPDLYDYEDPRASCDDTVSFLVEYWTSAVNGIAILFAGKTIAKGLGISPFQSGAAMLWLSCTQLLTRLAAAVSLYQYPEKLYNLERSEFTRPVGLFPIMMLKLVRFMMAFAPLGLISDFTKVLLHLPEGTIYPLYACIVVSLLGIWTRMRESVFSNKNPLAPTLLKPAKPLAKLFYAFSYIALWRKKIPTMNWGEKMEIFGSKMFESFPIVFWKTLGFGSVLSLSLLGPLVHLKAFSKIFQVEYCNNLPSISTKEANQKAIEERPERAYDMAWRHSVRWRKPQRLTVSKGWIYHDILYWYLFKGTVIERINDDRTDQIRKRVFAGRTIQDRVKRELEVRPKGTLLNGDREDWKEKAMRFQAQKHESNYISKRFEDPLGVAIYKAFGIGIGYNFDHMSELQEGEEPSARRLQARAAKSALRRYNELNDAEQALIAKIDKLEDREEKDRHQKLLDKSKKAFDEEIEYLAGKLKELIPTTSKVEEFGLMDAAKFKMKSEPGNQNVSSKEYQELEDDPLGFDKPSIRNDIV